MPEPTDWETARRLAYAYAIKAWPDDPLWVADYGWHDDQDWRVPVGDPAWYRDGIACPNDETIILVNKATGTVRVTTLMMEHDRIDAMTPLGTPPRANLGIGPT